MSSRSLPSEEKAGAAYEAGAELMWVKRPEFKPTGTDIEDPSGESLEAEEVTPSSMTGER